MGLEGTVALIAAAVLLGLAFIVLYGDWVYAGVIIWATFAIGVRNRSGEFLPAKLAVTSVSFALAGALCVVVFITIVRAALIYSGAHASLLHQEWYVFILLCVAECTEQQQQQQQQAIPSRTFCFPQQGTQTNQLSTPFILKSLKKSK